MLKRVETVKTPFSKLDFVESLITTWKKEYDVFPLKEQIGVIYAQWSIETGQGTYCWNNNIGNVKAIDIAGQTVEYCALNGVWEIINGKKVVLKPEDPGSWFRSFPSLDEGVKFHFDVLRNKRYKIAWTQVEAGSPAGFSHLLKQQGYYTAPETDYTKAVTAYHKAFLAANIFEQALSKVNNESFNEQAVDIIEPEGMPIVHPFIDMEYDIVPVEDDTSLKLTGWQQILNFLFKLIDLFIKKK